MLTALDSRAALQLVTDAAVGAATTMLNKATGAPEQRRATLLENIPEIISYFSAGSSALAADFYDDEREFFAPPKLYVAEPIIPDRTVKIRRAIAWAADPIFGGDSSAAEGRLAEVVQLESARPYRETILTNTRRDPSAAGWRRISGGGCKLCRMLADRGAVYTDGTALFATHTNCKCSAQPVFSETDFGEEASAMQYMASHKRRTPEARARLRDYLNTNYSDFPG